MLLAVLLIEVAGAFVLWLTWWPQFGPVWSAYYAVFHSVSAFTNASFELFAGSPVTAAAFPTDALTLLTLAAPLHLPGGASAFPSSPTCCAILAVAPSHCTPA